MQIQIQIQVSSSIIQPKFASPSPPLKLPSNISLYNAPFSNDNHNINIYQRQPSPQYLLYSLYNNNNISSQYQQLQPTIIQTYIVCANSIQNDDFNNCIIKFNK